MAGSSRTRPTAPDPVGTSHCRGIIAPPVTYEVDGEQYVAVMAGYGGAGALTSGTRAPWLPANTRTKVTSGLQARGKTPCRGSRRRTPPSPNAEGRSHGAQLENGKYAYMRTCMVCHGALVVSGGVIPDLRMLTRRSTRSSGDRVRRRDPRAGMPRSATWSPNRTYRHQAYIISRANEDRAAAAAAKPEPRPSPARAERGPGRRRRQKAIVASTPHCRGSEIEANGVPNVSVVRLFTPVTYWSSSRLVT